MKKIYSKKYTSTLLHAIVRSNFYKEEGRVDISPDDEYLQLAKMHHSKGQKFKPHKHIFLIRQTNVTQESWVVVTGSVKVKLYDLDDSILVEEVLKAGDCSITYHGGHEYEIMEDNTVVYEYKTGPYMGQNRDKVFL